MNLPDPKILITGANGFIGRHVAQELILEPILRSVRGAKNISDVPTLSVDLLDTPSLPILPLSIDVIYHFAGQIWGDESNEEKILTSVIAMAEQCGAKRIVYASTCAVYGRNGMEGPVDERTETAPMSPYAKGKLCGEDRLKRLAESSDIGVTVLRYFNPYGAGQYAKMAVPSMLAKAQAGTTIEIFGDGEQVRDFIYIKDLAKATIAAAHLGGSFEVFNIGSGHELTVNELASQIISASHSTSKIEHLPLPDERQNLEVHYRVANIDKITSLCNWRPETTLADGLKCLLSNR